MALPQLQAADPARAKELIEEVAAKGDVQNVSAFVVKGLKTHPQKRGGHEALGTPQRWSKQNTDFDGILGQYSSVTSRLDGDAINALGEADQARAVEILEDLAAKGHEIRNPSAFIAKSLQQYPQRRGHAQNDIGMP